MAAIDVLMPVRNGIRFLEEAIQSIRDQSFRDWRLLILDHGSSDGSAELANRHAERDRRIQVLPMPDAPHLGDLLNAGLERCDCRYVMRHDADDTALPRRMALMNEFCVAEPKYVVVGGEALMIDAEGRQIDRLQPPADAAEITAAGFFYNPIIHPTVTIRLEEFRKLGARYGEDFLGVVPEADRVSVNRCAEDYVLFGQLGLLGLCANIPVPLVKYRVHGGSESVSKVGEQIRLCKTVSRYLSKTFCRMNNLDYFDPEPFSNHSGHVSLSCEADLTDAYHKMAAALLAGIGDLPGVRRELAFRWVLATRQPLTRMMRYAQFELRHGRKSRERAVMRNWLRRMLRAEKYRFLEDPGAAPRVPAS